MLCRRINTVCARGDMTPSYEKLGACILYPSNRKVSPVKQLQMNLQRCPGEGT